MFAVVLERMGSFRGGRVLYRIVSAGAECGNDCSIQINGGEKAKKQRGLNLVIYNHGGITPAATTNVIVLWEKIRYNEKDKIFKNIVFSVDRGLWPCSLPGTNRREKRWYLNRRKV